VAGTHYADRNLSSVGDENFLEHQAVPATFDELTILPEISQAHRSLLLPLDVVRNQRELDHIQEPA